MENENIVVETKELPDPETVEKEKPVAGSKAKKKPKPTPLTKDKPKPGHPENVIIIGGQEIEIKPTKLKYHRNNTAYFYRVVDALPLPEIMAMPKGSFGDDRDGDKALMDWMIAVVDDVDVIVNNYDDIDTETIEKMLEIFKRLNRITEKEEKQKNAANQMRKE